MLCHRRFSMVRKVAGCGTCTGLGITATVFGGFKIINLFYCSRASMLGEAAGKDAEPTEGVTAA